MPAHWCAWHTAKWTNEWMDEWSHKCPWASVTGGWSSQHPQLLPDCCLAGSSPELSAPHIPQGPEADASSEEGQCFFGLQEFFWAFVPLPVAVQFARQGSSHVTGCVLCSSIQPPQRHKGGINWLKWVRRFPAPAHLQSPEEGGNSKCQWDRKSRRAPPPPNERTYSRATLPCRFHAETVCGLSFCDRWHGWMHVWWCSGVIGGHAHLMDDQNRGLLVNTEGSCPGWGQKATASSAEGFQFYLLICWMSRDV